MPKKHNPGCKCCGINFTLITQSCRQSGGVNVRKPSVSFTVKQGATTVATGTTDGSGVAAVQVPAAGSYSFTSTTPGGQTDTVTLTVSAGGTFRISYADQGAITLFACDSRAGSGGTVNFKFGGNVIGTATSNASGVATATFTGVNPRGTVTAESTLGSRLVTRTYVPSLAGTLAACGTPANVVYVDKLAIRVRDCTPDPNVGYLTGATAAFLNQATSTSLGSASTNSNGVSRVTPSVYPLDGEQIQATVSHPRFVTQNYSPMSPSLSLLKNCDGSDFSAWLTPNRLTVAAGYHCTGYSWPLKDTLTLNDPVGSVPMAYDSGQSAWVGCALRTVTGKLSNAGCTATGGTGTAPVYFVTDGYNGIDIYAPICGNGNFQPGSCGSFPPVNSFGIGNAYTLVSRAGPPSFAATFQGVFPGGFSPTLAGYIYGFDTPVNFSLVEV